MAGKKISELQALTTLTGEEELPVAINGDNRKVTSSLLVNEIKTAQSGLLTRVNDYMYDMSGLLGKLAYHDGVGTDEKNMTLGKFFNSNGVLVDDSTGILSYQYVNIDKSKCYKIKISNQGAGIYTLCLFDINNNLLKSILSSVDGYFIFTGVSKIGISGINNQNLIVQSFDIQDLTTVLNTQQGNRALYVAAGAVYNEQTGFYELNGLTDITEEEMKTIYLQTHVMDKLSSYYNIFAMSTFRTNLGFNMGITQTNGRIVSFRESFFFNQKLEVLRLSFGNNINETRMIRTDDMFYAFHGCKKLKRIINQIYVHNIKDKLYFDHTFSQCILLETALLYRLSASISFSDSPLLSLESLQYLITNATNTSPITVTVHSDVYAKIQDETNAEWHALIETAAAKQITFATA